MAATVNVPGFGPRPALAFRFRDEHGEIGKPTLLVLEDAEMAQVAVLVGQCVRRTLQVVREQRARKN